MDPTDVYYDLCRRLMGPLRTTTLTAAQLCEVGRIVHGRPEGFSLYGVQAPAMTAAGIQVLGRTSVECCVDMLSHAVAQAVAELLREGEGDGPLVAELFCGSGNLGAHLGRTLGVPVYASEIDPLVHDATSHNLRVTGASTRLRLIDYRALLPLLPVHGPLDFYVIEPPWGPAVTPDGLDLLGTSPPVPEILADILRARDHRPCLVGIKAIDRILHDSLNVAFTGARHLRTVATQPPFPDGVRMQFHIFRLGPPGT
ncbi:hypothetical protein AB0I81_43725 [Nonomuraea sp. NPDC050404]|uniref:hypothetical protein n=1 Tax=Nonomuraea sp. NPDC050404 TaxID=3155783 RepID=UPI0034090762